MGTKLNLILFLFMGMVSLHGQTITCKPVDKQLFDQKMAVLQKLEAESYGDTIVAIGKSFLETPYVEKTLEVGEKETLVINLRGFDCTTFVENVLAFSHLLRNNEADFDAFVEKLETIRYRDGVLNGYPSRLHYFTEWIRNNNEKGMVKDMTPDLGGVELQKPINFMGTHRDLYPFLADDDNFGAMLEVEEGLANETLCILPQDGIQSQEHNIQNGDIIALATSIKGLDVTHTGFAIKVDGRLHLLHASSAGEVTITKEPLVDYLKKIKNNIGIIVARPL
ncbi:N-acetylmuramoyl-L-alanine amidase-like domain-containing protein [Allomuricauda sp. d1]|uniref:N-acetylmuramoyl-L-alanine amidase-like domain-containing protein n=1 Tax=Allomuricauda sp. d1 TaxID=3136725 RepID=UPI0031D659DA